MYPRHGRNFVRTMLRVMTEQDEVRVVTDQVGTPTWARSLAEGLWTAAARPDLSGAPHWSDAGVASWYDFAWAIQEEALAAGLLTHAVPVRPLRTEESPSSARRPAFSGLEKGSNREALGRTSPHWRVNLHRMLQGLARG